ncbi:MAG: linear amide C-N hydrolase, partial [Algicola sp.]|nr:linear amide C-N hydrolase [Algicola sp.]
MCTYFTLNTPNQQPPYIAARSTENGTRFHSKMMFKMKTHVYCQKLPDSLTGGPTDQQPQWVGQLSQWMGKYAFVGMNDCPFPTLNTDDIAAHGMNTAGLVAGALTLIESEYQDPATIATTDTVILFPYLVNWLLSNFATCEEIKNALNGSVKIINPDPEYTEQNKAILLHFPVSDATGQSIVIEVLNGQIKVSNNIRYG